MGSAFEIYRNNLETVSAALWRRDLAVLLQHTALPNRVATLDREIVLSSREDMCLAMTEFRDHLDRRGAEAYVRSALSAEFAGSGETTILGTHMTRILRNGRPLVAPFLNRMTLLRIDGAWKSAFVEADTTSNICPYVAEDLAAAQRAHHARLDRLTKTRGRGTLPDHGAAGAASSP